MVIGVQLGGQEGFIGVVLGLLEAMCTWTLYAMQLDRNGHGVPCNLRYLGCSHTRVLAGGCRDGEVHASLKSVGRRNVCLNHPNHT